MKIGTWFAIYFVIWWTVLFAVLPFGARSQVETGEVVPGSEPGAPAKPNFPRIVIATSLISLVFLFFVWWLNENYGIS